MNRNLGNTILQASEELCCSEVKILSCFDININPEILVTEENINLLGTELLFANYIEPHGIVYKSNKLDEVVITYNNETNSMFGNFHTDEGADYVIERCRNGHVLKQYKRIQDHDVISDERVQMPLKLSKKNIHHQDKDKDNTNMAEFTVKFYYTEELDKHISDMEDWFDQIIAMENEALKNSKIPAKLKKYCTERTIIPEYFNSSFSELPHRALSTLTELKRLSNDVENSADFAALFTHNQPGYIEPGRPAEGLATIGGRLSVNIFHAETFRHEIGHNYGGNHWNSDPASGFAYGYTFSK